MAKIKFRHPVEESLPSELRAAIDKASGHKADPLHYPVIVTRCKKLAQQLEDIGHGMLLSYDADEKISLASPAESGNGCLRKPTRDSLAVRDATHNYCDSCGTEATEELRALFAENPGKFFVRIVDYRKQAVAFENNRDSITTNLEVLDG